MAIIPITRETAQNRLRDIEQADKRFYCKDGSVFQKLEDLEAGLDSMSDDVFMYHQNAEKHDFSNWVSDVFGDHKLARDLSRAKSAARAAALVRDRITFLRSKI